MGRVHKTPDRRLLRGLLLLGVLLLGGPLLIAALAGLFSFATQPPRLAVTVDAPAPAAPGEALALTLTISNPHDGPLILASVRPEEGLAAALGPLRYDPPPYQAATAVPGLPPGAQFDIPLEAGGALTLTIHARPAAAGALDGTILVCRPGDASVCTAVPLALTILPAP